MRTCTLAKALTGANSPADYAIMAKDTNAKKLHAYTHKPYQCGNRNLISEYSALLKQKGVKICQNY